VGLVTAYGGVDDHGLNQIAWEALQSIEAQAQMARLDNIESIDARDWEKNIHFFVDQGYDVIVTVGVNLSEATIETAKEYPDILFIGIDQQAEEEYENVATVYFKDEQAGFLTGTLAALVTEVDKVGAVCETSGIDAVWLYCEGFRAGALFTNENVRIYVAYREGGSSDKFFNDPEWGEERILKMIEDGVDVITAFGGNTANGAFLKASEKGVLVIGSEEDLFFQLPDVQPELITSIIKDPSMALSSLVYMASQKQIYAGSYTGEIVYKPLQNIPRRASDDIETNFEEIYNALLEGTIVIELPEKN
jgi:basic membrane protein A